MRWQARAGVSCNECRVMWEKTGMAPPCGDCDFPGLWPENLEAWEALQHCLPVMFDGWGGMRLENARIMCQALGIPWDRELVLKLTAGAAVLLEESRHGAK